MASLSEYSGSSCGESSYFDSSCSSPVSPVPLFSKTSRLIKWSLPPPTVPGVLLPGWEPMPYQMEQFWASSFAYFFRSFIHTDGHLWTLTPVSVPPISTGWSWHQCSFSAKVRFQCPCRQNWSSVKGRVIFWYRLRRQGDEILPEVLFKLYGQLCSRCSGASQDFLPALWYYEEIENAMRFLRSEITKTYYGGRKQEPPRRLRVGRPRNLHDTTKCQACFEGLCINSCTVKRL